jgi:hypothetical protein
MTTSIIDRDLFRSETNSRPFGETVPDHAEALDDVTIADFSLIAISQMTRDELVRVVRASRLPLLTIARDEHLQFHDRQTLERLVHLARRCCHNRMTASLSRRSVVSGGE